MPTYNYRCSKCESEFEKIKPISARKEPEEQPCPECGTVGKVAQIIGASKTVHEIGGSLSKAGDGWREVLSKVKENHLINNIRD